MYLSRLTLNLSHPVVARAASDLHALHRLVLQGFPDAAEGGTGRVLYRLERPTGPRSLPTMIVQSEKEADWSSLEALTLQIDGPREYNPAHSSGQMFRFRLRATPTKKTFFGEEAARPGHRRVGFFKEDEQREWLERKGRDGGGFEVVQVRVTSLGWQEGKKPSGGILRHHAVEFDGSLKIIDPLAFAETLASGVGPAKGFGFGLLSIARLT